MYSFIRLRHLKSLWNRAWDRKLNPSAYRPRGVIAENDAE